MGFWHTGYGEFHEPVGLGELPEPQPIIFKCGECEVDFHSRDELYRHRFENHPQKRPIIVIQGIHLSSAPLKIRKPIIPSDVILNGVTSCFLNAKKVEPQSLGVIISKEKSKYFTIELINSDIKSSFKIDVDIASEEDLSGIETAFLRMARSENLSIHTISSFADECRNFESAKDYYDGICLYLFGVLAKEQHPDSALTRDKYIEYYNRAGNQLNGFNRVLASNIRALISFNFNQFSEAQQLAPPGRLNEAASAFCGALDGLPWHYSTAFSAVSANATEDLLTDRDTLIVLQSASLGVNQIKENVQDLNILLKRVVGSFDRVKLEIILAEGYYAKKCKREARQIARKLRSIESTQAWAKNMLEKTEK